MKLVLKNILLPLLTVITRYDLQTNKRKKFELVRSMFWRVFNRLDTHGGVYPFLLAIVILVPHAIQMQQILVLYRTTSMVKKVVHVRKVCSFQPNI